MKRVITYGTFDLFHQGHYNIIKRAKEYGDYLIVGVTSESYDIERGKLSVQDSITKRIENVKATGLVDEVIIEEYLGQKTRDIIKYNIDTLVIGSDWYGKFDHLKKLCDVQYLERTKNISSTMIREESGRLLTMGIATDNLDDAGVVMESKYISGFNVQSVFADNLKLAEEFCEKYQMYDAYDKYGEFLKAVDVVYIKTDIDKRHALVKQALEAGVHVICDSPFSIELEKAQELFDLAKSRDLALIENITMLFLRAFSQLLWMAEGDIIGETISVKASCSYDNFTTKNSFLDMVTLSSALIIKMLGHGYKDVEQMVVRDKDGEISYAQMFFKYKNAVGVTEIGNSVELTNALVIIGEQGTLTVADNWWETGYFELKMKGSNHVKKYSFNFEGNGFRYILQELFLMVRDKRFECTRFFPEESLSLVDLLSKTDLSD